MHALWQVASMDLWQCRAHLYVAVDEIRAGHREVCFLSVSVYQVEYIACFDWASRCAIQAHLSQLNRANRYVRRATSCTASFNKAGAFSARHHTHNTGSAAYNAVDDVCI